MYKSDCSRDRLLFLIKRKFVSIIIENALQYLRGSFSVANFRCEHRLTTRWRKMNYNIGMITLSFFFLFENSTAGVKPLWKCQLKHRFTKVCRSLEHSSYKKFAIIRQNVCSSNISKHWALWDQRNQQKFIFPVQSNVLNLCFNFSLRLKNISHYSHVSVTIPEFVKSKHEFTQRLKLYPFTSFCFITIKNHESKLRSITIR